MQCKKCNNLRKINNTDETGQALCSYNDYFRPININDERECIWLPKPYTCGDCEHYRTDDAACFTCRKDDSAYNKGELCAGFEDTKEWELYNIIIEWTLRGYDVKYKLDTIYAQFIKEYKYPIEEKK